MTEPKKEEDLTKFIKRLPLMNLGKIKRTFYEMLPLCGVGTTIAFSKFLLLQKRVVFATHSLANAYRKNHQTVLGKPLDDTLLVRSMYFECAIEAYNKVVDYVYQILYFNYKLYEVLDKISINSKKDIVMASKRIKDKKLKTISSWISKEERTKGFAKEFFKYMRNMREVRNLANDIKHRGCVDVGGINPTRYSKVTKKLDGNTVNITSLVSEIKIDLDLEIDKLVEVHNLTFELQKKLYILCDFQQQLQDFFDEHV